MEVKFDLADDGVIGPAFVQVVVGTVQGLGPPPVTLGAVNGAQEDDGWGDRLLRANPRDELGSHEFGKVGIDEQEARVQGLHPP